MVYSYGLGLALFPNNVSPFEGAYNGAAPLFSAATASPLVSVGFSNY